MKSDQIKKINDLTLLAQSSKDNGDFSSAINYLSEILKLDINHVKALNNIGNIYKEIKKFDKAIEQYTKALEIDPNYKIAKINLAILKHDLGNLSEAQKLYKDVISSDKYNFAIYFNLSRINFNFFDEKKINFIFNALQTKQNTDYNKASGYFILAKNEQIKKNFKKEIEFLKKGHEYFCKSISSNILQQSLNYWINVIPKKFDKIEIKYSKKSNSKYSDINPIFIIGMPRSGSTLVESIISSGKLKIPNGGETAIINWAVMKNSRNYLIDKNSSKIKLDKDQFMNNIINKYQSLNLLHDNKKNFFTDKSLENFFYIDIISKVFPNAKFIHCRRNKIDNIFAIYQNFLTKMSWTHTLENIIRYFDNYLNIITKLESKHKNKILSIDLEGLTFDSVNISKKMFEFCKLEWSKESLEYYKRKDLFSATSSNIQIREKIFKYNEEKYNVYKDYLKKFEQDYNWLKLNR